MQERVFDNFSYFWFEKQIHPTIKKKKREKETHTVWLVNHSHLRIVNKIIIFNPYKPSVPFLGHRQTVQNAASDLYCLLIGISI